MKKFLLLIVLMLFLVGCQAQAPATETPQLIENTTPVMGGGMGNGMGNGMGSNNGMSGRHHATVPEPYAGKMNDVAADEASIQRGGEIYTTLCASCHGQDGMGSGPAGVDLNPAPSPVARTSQMMGDAYLLWRISEGGVPFSTQMPVWKNTLGQEQIWDVVNYMRTLSSGMAGHGMGEQNQEQAAMHAEMLANAIAQGIITQAEADTFTLVHDAMETYLIQNSLEASTGDEKQAIALATLVEAGTLTQEQVDTFNTVHQRLLDSGLMQ
jgi:mono/diheme cytochrome c family protein